MALLAIQVVDSAGNCGTALHVEFHCPSQCSSCFRRWDAAADMRWKTPLITTWFARARCIKERVVCFKWRF